VQATTITLVYTIDSYRPVAGEITVTQLAFKGKYKTSNLQKPVYSYLRLLQTAAFGFLLSFYTNPWIAESGYARSFGAMAGISGGAILMWVPMYVFGRRIREASWNWAFVRRLAHWDDDREVGE